QLGIAFDLVVVSRAPREVLADAVASSPDAVVSISPPAAPAPLEPPVRDADIEDAAPIGRAVVRVELSRLDELQDQLSLLIVSRFRLEREIAAHAERGHDVRGLRQVAELQSRQLRDLRRAILRARMVRVAEVFEPLSLLIRSLSRSTGR